MKTNPTAIPEVLLIQPDVHRDERGHFLETYRYERYPGRVFVQDCLSHSRKGVLRGLHLQWPSAQGKLVWVVAGEVFDVAVDVRRGSPNYAKWVGHTLSGHLHQQLYIPGGFAHGFLVTSDEAWFAYKCTERYDPGGEVTIRWNDPQIAIDWPIDEPLLSAKDAAAPLLAEIDANRLP